jgi:hypothetical protein
MAQHRADPLTKYLERPLVRGIDAASGHDVHGSPLDAGQQKLRLVHRLNEAADVVTENLAVDLILHRGLGLAPDMPAELGLYHPDRGLDVRPLVVMLVELLPMQVPEMVGMRPNPAGLVKS